MQKLALRMNKSSTIPAKKFNEQFNKLYKHKNEGRKDILLYLFIDTVYNSHRINEDLT